MADNPTSSHVGSWRNLLGGFEMSDSAAVARPLHYASVALLAATAIKLVAELASDRLWLLPSLLFFTAGLAGQAFFRAGRVNAGRYLLVGFMLGGFLATLLPTLLAGGLPVWAAMSAVIWFASTVVAAGLFLGPREILATAIIGTASLILAWRLGVLDTATSLWLPIIVSLVAEIAVFGFLVNLVFQTAARARAEGLEARRGLDEARSALHGEIEGRTRALALAAAISQQITQIQDVVSLLQNAVELIRERFELYHVQVYLLSPMKNELVLRAATGDVGAQLLRRHHRLPVGPGSVNGTAAADRQPIIVPFARISPLFLPNPLLPETQSEMAIPMIFEDEVIGTLNLQSSVPGRLAAENLAAFTVLAGQLATAVENARLFNEIAEAREQLTLQAAASTHDAWELYLEDQPADMALDGAEGEAGPGALRQPIAVRGTTIGYMELDAPATDTSRAKELTAAVAGQLGAHLENLRLTRQAEQALSEAHEREKELAMINRVVTALGESTDLYTSLQIIVDQLALATSIEQVGIAILNEERTGLTVVADRSGRLQTDSAVGFTIPLENNPASQMAITERHSVVVHNATENPLTASAHEVLRQRGVKTILILPLIVENDVLGTVGLDVVEEGIELTLDQLRLAETIVYQAASAVQRAKLFNQTEDARRAAEQLSQQLEHLSRIEANLSLASTEDEMLRAVAGGPPWGDGPRDDSADGSADKPAFDFSYISTRPEDGALLIESVGRLNDEDYQAGGEQLLRELPLSALWLDNPREVLVIQDAENDPRLDEAMRAQARREGWRALAMMPLRRAGQWQGLFTLGWRAPHTLTADEAFLLRRLHEPLAATVAGRRAYLAQRAALAQTESLLADQARLSGQLRAVSDVSVTAAATLDVDRLLAAAADLTKANFNLYHTQIFLIEDDRATLALRAAAGAIGRQMVEAGARIPIGEKSIIARAAREREAVLAPDTAESADYLPHPLLPDTRSEMAVPLIISDRLLGVLDVQSDRAGRFQPDDIQVYKILASQLAVATQNATYFAEQLEMAEKLREVDRLKTDFLARMSHELRTPLNSIIGFADVLLMGLDGELNERMVEDLQLIRGSGHHLRDIIGDILDMSRIEAGRLDLIYETFDVRRVAAELMATVAPLAEQKGVDVRIDIDDGIGPLTADRTRIRQVLWNLVGNAIKFTDRGHITIAVRPRNGEVLFSVTDTGIGIAPEHLPHIFDHFSQIEAGRRESISGTGLGLSISKNLVELHGGHIWAESQVGRGSAFCFTLPTHPDQT